MKWRQYLFVQKHVLLTYPEHDGSGLIKENEYDDDNDDSGSNNNYNNYRFIL